jgi:hypothetical protein
MRRQRYEQEKNKHKNPYVVGAKDIMSGTLKASCNAARCFLDGYAH